jgi:UDP-glucose 4-epimerase
MGFIGSYLFREFPDAIGLDLKNGKDILSCELPDADIILHLAAEPDVMESIKDPFKNAQTNILGTIRLLQRYKNSKFIFTSTGGAIQETIESPYGLSKFCCEEYIKLLHDNYVILRLPNVYGENSRSVIDKFIYEKVVVYGDGSAIRTYAHVSDIVRGIKQAIEWPVGLYKLGCEQDLTVKQLAEATGKPITYVEGRKGELQYSKVENTTPGWYTLVDVMEYIKGMMHDG